MLTLLTLPRRSHGTRLRRLARALARAVEMFLSILPSAESVRVRIPVRRGSTLAKVLVPALAAGLVLAAPTARASNPFRYVADGQLVDVQILVDGSSAPLYFRPGTWDRSYFQSFRGRNYSLVVTNNSGDRVGVLISVDGLNVVNGERSSLAGSEPMYVLAPYEHAVIQGWRTSLQDVRRFVFVDEERSYAERTGQASGDLGWIRVLSFREQRPRVWVNPRHRDDENEWRRDGASEPQSGSDQASPPETRTQPKAEGKDGLAKERADALRGAPAPESNPGTGWGDQRWDPVQRTVFLAATSPTDHIILRYEYESGLRALGIYPRHGRTWMRERGELGWGFARPPRW